MINHEAEFAAGFEDAIDLLEDAFGMRRMVDHTPGPYEIEFVISEAHLFGIHATHIGGQAAQVQPAPGILDGPVSEIDAGQIAAGFGHELCMRAQAAADLEDPLTAKQIEGNPSFEGTPERAGGRARERAA